MNNERDLSVLRHSAAHLLAQAISELFPGTQLTIGPATAEGFFYDCLPIHNFKEEDLPVLEKRMHEIARRNLPITHEQMPKSEARKLYKDNPFKLELIDQIPGDTVGIARQGDFYDLCRGGHVASTGDIKYFKLLTISGSYWRADKSNQALQRISGTAFFTQEDLDAFEQRRIDAQLYDHRRLGKELDLFSFHEEGPGFPFYHPRGKKIINTLTSYLRKLLDKAGYQEIATPSMLSADLWKQSGHYTHYKDNMYFCDVEGKQFAIKPMNCPGAILVYKERPRSYRELPLRLSEFGLVHRHELSGVLHGLFRVRSFTQDDAHIFCTPDQIEQEVSSLIELTYRVWHRFNFTKINVRLSTKPANSMGSNEKWEKATKALEAALKNKGIPYTLDPGEGAFYGPKIDFGIEDSMGRAWQCTTIQVDFTQPENFDLWYVAPEGTKARPVIIHRAILGSFERFLGIILEHYKGKLPFWIAPMQVAVLTITDAQKPYAQTIVEKLNQHDISAMLDQSSDQISGKIKNAQLQRIPWMFVIGKKEVAENTITVRYLDGTQEPGLTLAQVLEKAAKEQQ